MKKITFLRAFIVFFLCYITFFLFEHRKAIYTVYFEDHRALHEKYASVVPNTTWTKEKKDAKYLEGYATTNSAYPGQIVEVFISTDQKKISGKVIRWGVQRKPAGKSDVRGDFIESLGEIGGNRIFIRVRKSWKTGVYMVQLSSESGLSTNVIFIVRPRVLGSVSNTAVILGTTSWQVYNSYPKNGRFPPGGFYRPAPYGSVDEVSFNRPYNTPTKPGYAGLPYAFYHYDASLIHFLEKHGYQCEYLAEDDIWDKGMVLPYKNLIFGDHTEYLRVYEQDNIVRFLQKGNNIIYANGNPFYAQIQPSEDGRSIKLMWDEKDRYTSLFGEEQHTQYGRFYPASKITGVNFIYNAGEMEPFFLPYTVVKPEHWIYKGTKLKKGEKFSLFGDERDNVDEYSPANIEILAEAKWPRETYIMAFINYMDSGKKLDFFLMRTKQTVFDLIKIFLRQLIPDSFKDVDIMGVKPSEVLRSYMIKPNKSDLRSGQMVYYKNAQGGQVFSTGMCQWNWNMVPMDTLREDPIISRIFKNVLEAFAVPKSRNKP